MIVEAAYAIHNPGVWFAGDKCETSYGLFHMDYCLNIRQGKYINIISITIMHLGAYCVVCNLMLGLPVLLKLLGAKIKQRGMVFIIGTCWEKDNFPPPVFTHFIRKLGANSFISYWMYEHYSPYCSQYPPVGRNKLLYLRGGICASTGLSLERRCIHDVRMVDVTQTPEPDTSGLYYLGGCWKRPGQAGLEFL